MVRPVVAGEPTLLSGNDENSLEVKRIVVRPGMTRRRLIAQAGMAESPYPVERRRGPEPDTQILCARHPAPNPGPGQYPASLQTPDSTLSRIPSI